MKLLRSRSSGLPESLAQGLVNRAAPLGELQAATDVLLTQILSKPRLALGMLLFCRQLKVGRQAACNNAADTLACHLKDARAPWGHRNATPRGEFGLKSRPINQVAIYNHLQLRK